METRKVVIMDTASKSTVEIMTNATTFGELKTAASAAGVQYQDKDWLEAITKQIPASDDSLLPTGHKYKGVVTNDLVFVLSNTNKKIKSGAASRKDILKQVKELGLVEHINNKYDQNYTRIKTEILQAEIDLAMQVEDTFDIEEPVENNYHALVTAVGEFLASLDEGIMRDIENQYRKVSLLKKPEVPVSVSFSTSDLAELLSDCSDDCDC